MKYVDDDDNARLPNLPKRALFGVKPSPPPAKASEFEPGPAPLPHEGTLIVSERSLQSNQLEQAAGECLRRERRRKMSPLRYALWRWLLRLAGWATDMAIVLGR